MKTLHLEDIEALFDYIERIEKEHKQMRKGLKKLKADLMRNQKVYYASFVDQILENIKAKYTFEVRGIK